jgi:DNA-binding MarR family transcriptional regulator
VSASDDELRRVWRTLSTLVHNDDRRAKVADALGMSFARVKALRHLAQAPATGRELAALLATDPPFVTVIVDDLEQRGLVKREPHPTDRRAKLVRATAAGRKAAEQAERLLDEPPDALRALPPKDLAALERILARLGGDAAA